MSSVSQEIKEAFEAGMAYEEEKQINRFLKFTPSEAFTMYLNEPQKFILKFGERDAT